MKNWKKNLLAASVLLVVCVGIYMNWMYTNAGNVGDFTDTLDADKVLSENGIILNTDILENLENTTITDYFAAVRLSRQQARDSAVNLLQEAMAYSEGEDKESSAKLEQIVQTALCEAQIESLIIAKGYTDCVTYMSDDGVSVAVAAPEGGIQQADVAVIADIVVTQSEYDMEQVRVVEVQ